MIPQPALQHRLLSDFQREFPLVAEPFAEIARRLGTDEATVLALLQELQADGVVSRVGPVVAPHRAGWSTLAAIAVPPAHLEEVAALVSDFPEVNHNYEREHALNLWFVVAAPCRARVMAVLAEVEYRTGLAVVDLPLEEAFRLETGFAL